MTAVATTQMDEITPELELPGFRFHPTEEELLDFYLKNMVFGKRESFDVIGFLNIYRHDPSDLPGLAKIGEREWFFFVPRDSKHGTGGRPNRTTENGFWKATGSDRKIVSLSDQKRIIGLRKTLVFYKGRAPRGSKTDWVMNEYRLPDTCQFPKDVVLCKIYRKATSLKVLEQRAAVEEKTKTYQAHYSSPSSPMDTILFCCPQEDLGAPMSVQHSVSKKEVDELEVVEGRNENDEKQKERKGSCSSLQLAAGKDKLPELQVPKLSMDWTQDSFWIQFSSPWLQNLTPICQHY